MPDGWGIQHEDRAAPVAAGNAAQANEAGATEAADDRPAAATARAWLGSLAANVANLAIGLATGTIAARILGPHGRGELAEIVFWGTTAAGLATLAVPSALTIQVARDPGDRRWGANAVVLSVLLSALAILVFAPFGRQLIGSATFAAGMLFLALYVPVNLIGLDLVALDQGHERFSHYNLTRLLPAGVYLVGIIALCAVGRVSAASLAIALWLGSAAVVLARGPAAWRRIEWRLNARQLSSLLATGLSFHAAAIASILLQRADQFVLIAYFNPVALGLYAVAMTTSGVGIGLVSSATTSVLLPQLARTASGDEQRSRFRRGLGLTFVAAIALNLVVAAAAPSVIPLVFGRQYAAATGMAVLLCLTQIPLTYVTVATILLRAMGDWRTGVVAPMLSLAAFALTIGWLIGPLGASGVPAALLLAWTAAALYVVAKVARRFDLAIWQALLPSRTDLSAAARRAKDMISPSLRALRVRSAMAGGGARGD